MLRLFILLFSCVAVCAQPVLSLNDPTVVAKSSSLLQGLQGYWQLEEGSGSGTRYDRSPNGNHLTAVNSPGSATGKVGNSATFTSASSQYLVGNTNQFEGTSVFSVFFWFKGTNAADQVMSCRYDISNSRRAWSVNTVTNCFRVTLSSDGTFNSGSVKDYRSTNSVIISNWIHLGFVWNAGVLSLYINGNSISPTKTTDASFSSVFGSVAKLGIGANNVDGTAGAFTTGALDEVGIWKRALSTNEITQLYRSGLGVTYPRFSMRDNRADDFNWDTWEPIYDKPKPFPTLMAFVNRREPEPLLTICE